MKEVCTKEPREKCRMVTEEVCHQEDKTTCEKVPREESRQECKKIDREVSLLPVLVFSRDFTITEKAPTWAFCWLKAFTS